MKILKKVKFKFETPFNWVSTVANVVGNTVKIL
jgi:hypothetical protein